MVTIADMETFSMSIDSGMEEWNPMDAKGWRKALVTAKALTISLSGKRNYGDPGNDYVAGKTLKNGRDCDSKMSLTFPNGDKLEMDCVISVTNFAGGDSTNVQPLEFDLASHGEPVFTTAPVEELSK